jgi:hypothetical protein
MAQSIGCSDYAIGGVGLSARLALGPPYIMEVVGSFTGAGGCVLGTRLTANLHLVRRLRVDVPVPQPPMPSWLGAYVKTGTITCADTPSSLCVCV